MTNQPRRTISVEINGQTYWGTYRVESGLVYVHSHFGWQATQQGGSPARVIARLLLSELVRAVAERGDRTGARVEEMRGGILPEVRAWRVQ